MRTNHDLNKEKYKLQLEVIKEYLNKWANIS